MNTSSEIVMDFQTLCLVYPLELCHDSSIDVFVLFHESQLKQNVPQNKLYLHCRETGLLISEPRL